jgi:FAD/FMN-containing dehydrogenase
MPNSPSEVLSIIDIGQLTGMEYDESGGIRSIFDSSQGGYKFRVAAGNQNWNGYVALYKESGKTIPGGSCYSVGAGGHICGGGYGFFVAHAWADMRLANGRGHIGSGRQRASVAESPCFAPKYGGE